MRASSKETAVALTVLSLIVATMAVDHLIGTDDEPGEESGAADPAAFALSVLVSGVLLAVLFAFLVRRRREDPDGAAKAGMASSLIGVPALALLFLAIQLPFAGAGIALGLRGRHGAHPRLAAAAVVVGSLVLALTVVAYALALA